MARIVGVDLPREKRVEIGLTYIFGVGRSRAQQALTATGAPGDTLHRIRAGIAAPQRTAAQTSFNPGGQLKTRYRHRQLAPRYQRLNFTHYGDP